MVVSASWIGREPMGRTKDERRKVNLQKGCDADSLRNLLRDPVRGLKLSPATLDSYFQLTQLCVESAAVLGNSVVGVTLSIYTLAKTLV